MKKITLLQETISSTKPKLATDFLIKDTGYKSKCNLCVDKNNVIE